MIAGVLRNRIVNGELEDGKVLPKHQDFLIEFGVSLPSLREAMRILETEGLISERRGNRGVYPDVKLRRRDVIVHETIAQAIFDGDQLVAERASRRHLEQVHRWLLANAGNQPLA